MKIKDEMFNEIYEIVEGVLTSRNVSNIKRAKIYIDVCHEKFGMKQNLSEVGNYHIFYLNNEPDRTHKIDLSLAPKFENRTDFIKWTKNEITQVIENLK